MQSGEKKSGTVLISFIVVSPLLIFEILSMYSALYVCGVDFMRADRVLTNVMFPIPKSMHPHKNTPIISQQVHIKVLFLIFLALITTMSFWLIQPIK